MDCCSQPGLKPFAPTRQQMLNAISPVSETECLPISQAQGRILAQAITSPLAVPPFDNSAMDGYALASIDIQQDGLTQLPLGHRILAGDSDQRPLQAGTCARIMTGAPMPAGADTVVMQENTSTFEQDGQTWVKFEGEIKTAANVRYAGSDVQKDEPVVSAHTQLKSYHISQLACLGIAKVEVFRRVKVAIFSTGDELIPPGQTLAPGQIYDSNRIGVHSMLNNLNVEVRDFGILPDDPQVIREAIVRAAAENDVIISSGGVSVGEADYTKEILDEVGDINFWKLAIKPGKPFAYGKIGQCDFMGLPGNPVSAYVTFYQLAYPALLTRMGSLFTPGLQLPAISLDTLKKRPGRMDFQRGFVSTAEDGQLQVQSTGSQGSAIFTSMLKANCFIVLEQDRGSVKPGETVTIEMFSDPM